MFKKIFYLSVIVGILTANSLNPTQIKAAIKSNPAILDTPAAKAKMAQAGVDKQQVLEKINQTPKTTTTTQEEVVQNKIDIKENQDNKQKNINNTIDNKIVSKTTYINPFSYKTNQQILSNLYSKQSYKTAPKLSRYGLNFFKNKNKKNLSSLAVPSYYIVNKNDQLKIWLYGATNNQLSLKVNNNGNIDIPKIGPIFVAGKSFADVQKLIINTMQKNYPNTQVTVDISEYSTIQVNLVGDVKAPGVYNVASLSTVKDLLILANGIKSTGTIRDVVIKRDHKILAIIDFYKLLKDADESLNIILRAGDIIFVPKVNKLVSIYGQVNTPAIYELKNKENLQTLLNFAGGLKYNASKYGFLVKRFVNNNKTKTFEVDLSQANKFNLKNGDSVFVYPIDKVHKESIYLYGNVVRPGERELQNNNSLHKLLNQEITKLTLKGIFLDDTLFDYAIIKRKTNNLDKKIISFNLKNIIDGKKDIQLQNDDEIFIFNRYNSNIAPFVTITGKPVGKVGKYAYYDNMKVRDLINIAGATPYSKIRLTTYDTDDLMPHISFVDENYTLAKFDEIELFDYYMTNKIENVSIKGAVNIPNSYSLNPNMTIKDLIQIAGGLKKDVYNGYLRLTRVNNIHGKKFENEELALSLEDILKDGRSNIKLQDKDSIYIYSIDEMVPRESIVIKGEIKHAGKYLIGKNMTLKDIILAAGGFTEKAFKNRFEIVRYTIVNNERIRNILQVPFNDISKFKLKDNDEVSVFTIPNWYDKKTITLKGEVKFPGVYTVESGEKLSSVIKRAGGFTKNAFIKGAVFSRLSVKKNEEKRMQDAIAKLKQEIAYISVNAREAGEAATNGTEMIQMVNMLEKQAKRFQALGRISIDLDNNITKFENSVYNIRVEDKDTLIIPSFIDTISIYGEVLNQNTFIYDPDLDAADYIQKAGGLTQKADQDSVYIVLPTGEAKKVTLNCLFGCSNNVPQGSSIVIPMKLKFTSNLLFWKDVSQVVYQLAITTASLHTIGSL